MSDTSWISDFTVSGRAVRVKKTGADASMIFVPPGATPQMRVDGSWVSDKEVKAMCEFLRTQGSAVYEHVELHASPAALQQLLANVRQAPAEAATAAVAEARS